jgi:hypothetical protein
VAVKYQVTLIESERGWGQTRDYVQFDTVEKAIEYRDHINSQNKPGPVPDWYMIAEQDIKVVEI